MPADRGCAGRSPWPPAHICVSSSLLHDSIGKTDHLAGCTCRFLFLNLRCHSVLIPSWNLVSFGDGPQVSVGDLCPLSLAVGQSMPPTGACPTPTFHGAVYMLSAVFQTIDPLTLNCCFGGYRGDSNQTSEMYDLLGLRAHFLSGFPSQGGAGGLGVETCGRTADSPRGWLTFKKNKEGVSSFQSSGF